jgi:beta-barrel assembly-enhancing protease
MPGPAIVAWRCAAHAAITNPASDMADLMHGIGRWLRGKISSARWIYTELTGSEAQAIKAERVVGAGMAAAIAAELPTKPFSDDLVESCGRHLAARVKDRHRQFTFRVLPTDQINAFALPGGFIYITQPLLSLLRWDPHCIAFVLGHEMGHVIRCHAKDRIVGGSLLSVLTAAFPAAGVARAPLQALARGFLQSAYSQDQELEADAVGVKLAGAAGFDRSAAIAVLRNLASLSDSPSALESYFSSHPPHELRISNIQRLLRRAPTHLLIAGRPTNRAARPAQQ